MCGGVVRPAAPLPLWQLEQFTSVAACVNTAPNHVTVLLWQVSHGATVGTWFAGLPSAVAPSWQLAQPVAIPAWLKVVAPPKLAVLLWQPSHGAAVTT